MKKKIIIISVLVVFIIALLLIPTKVYQKIFNKEEPKSEQNEPSVYQTLFVRDSNSYLVGVNVKVKAIEEDVVCQKWELLTNKSYDLPHGYSTPIDVNTTLISHETKDGVLTLNLSEEFINSEGRASIECLAWNFCVDDVTQVVVKVNDQVINEVNGYYYKEISKNLGVNLTYESAYLFEADYVTVVSYQDDLIKPVTYLFNSKNNIYDYTIKKIFNSDDSLNEMVMANGYSYTLEKDVFVITMDYNDTLSENLVKSLTETINMNFDIKSLVINGTDSVLLEINFEETTNI